MLGARSFETRVARAEERQIRRKQLNQAMRGLKAREKRIFILRRLEDDPMTLEALSRDYGISRERVRQIEGHAYEKVRKSILKAHAEQQRAVRATLESCAAAAGR